MVNEKRLIDANRAMEIVRDQGIAHPNAYHLTNYATLILREAPTVDAVEVRHGRWNDWEVFWKECSCCRYRTQKINAREYSFCPNCGAKMDLEENWQ